MPSFKVLVSDQRGVKPYTSNALRFAEAWEADWYARDLFSRWLAMDSFAVEVCDDDPTCHVASEPTQWIGNWNAAARCYTGDRTYSNGYTLVHAVRPTEHYQAAALAICEAFTVAREALDRLREREANEQEPAFLTPWSREVQVGQLPAHVRDALTRVGYACATVPLEVCYRKLHVSSVANDGQRVTIVTAASWNPREGTNDVVVSDKPLGVWKLFAETGPWGGPNPFEKTSIDACPVRAIPVGGCIVVARTARNRKSPWVTLHALAIDALAWLSPDAPELAVASDLLQLQKVTAAHTLAREGLEALAQPSIDPLDVCILTIYRGIKGGHRAKYIERAGDADRVKLALDSLVARGLLKRSKSGATSLSPEGKNAIAHVTSNGMLRTPEGACL